MTPSSVTLAQTGIATNATGFARAVRTGTDPGAVLDHSSLRYLDCAGFAALDELIAEHRVAVVLSPGSVLRTVARLVGLPSTTAPTPRAAARRADRSGRRAEPEACPPRPSQGERVAHVHVPGARTSGWSR